MTIDAAGYCSPKRVKNKKETGTCLTLQELQTVAALYNKQNPTNMIPHSVFSSAANLVKELDSRFNQRCKSKDDLCWIKQSEVGDLYNNLKNNYRPNKPIEWKRNKRTWLNTYDILHVMGQYEDESFKFLGVFPVDFNVVVGDTCVVREMCRFSINNLRKEGIESFGIVFNLDRHDQPGSHWVSCYSNINPKNKKFGIAYYDSGGVKPPKTIQRFMKSVRDEVFSIFRDHKQKFHVKYNNNQHQFLDTECGIFSMLFIVLCKENPDEPYRTTRQKIPVDKRDNKIHAFRDMFYSPF